MHSVCSPDVDITHMFRSENMGILPSKQAWKVLLRQRVWGSLLIQTMFRRHHKRDAFLKQRRSSIRIQSFVRKWLKRGAFASQRESILCLQKWAKRNIARVEGRKREAMSKVIAYVQACARRVLHAQHYRKVVCSAIKIQVAFDMMIDLQRKRKSAKLKNIITIQSLVRRCQARTRYSRQVMCSAIKNKMQVAFDRKEQEQRKKSENLPNLANVIVNMQSMVQRGQARTRFAKRMQEAAAAKSIQKWWGEVQRSWKAKSIIITQSVFRMYNSQKAGDRITK